MDSTPPYLVTITLHRSDSAITTVIDLNTLAIVSALDELGSPVELLQHETNLILQQAANGIDETGR